MDSNDTTTKENYTRVFVIWGAKYQVGGGIPNNFPGMPNNLALTLLYT